MVVDATSGEYQWEGSFVTPSSEIGATFGKEIVLEGNTQENAFGLSSFEIVTSVPEPRSGAFALTLLAGVATRVARRRTQGFCVIASREILELRSTRHE
jgi:hypothetical protein